MIPAWFIFFSSDNRSTSALSLFRFCTLHHARSARALGRFFFFDITGITRDRTEQSKSYTRGERNRKADMEEDWYRES